MSQFPFTDQSQPQPGIQSNVGTPFNLDLVTFGIPSLDNILGGGFSRGSVILIEDEIGSESDPFLVQFLAQGLRGGDYTYILSTEHTFEHFEAYFSYSSTNSRNLYETGRLQYIDGFSNPFGYSDIKQQFTHTIQNLTQPREVNDSIRRALLSVQQKKLPTRGVIDSLSTFIHALPSSSLLFSLLHTRIASNKQNNDITLLTLHHDAHDPILVKSLEHIVDGVIRITPHESDGKPIQRVSVIHMQGKPELSRKYADFSVLMGRISPA